MRTRRNVINLHPSKVLYIPMDVAELDEIYLNEDAWIADDEEEEEWTTLTEEEAKAEMQEYHIQQEANQAKKLLNLSPDEHQMREIIIADSKKAKKQVRKSGKQKTGDKDKDECQLKITTAMIPDKKERGPNNREYARNCEGTGIHEG